MKSIFDNMTPEQKEAALNYKGEEAFGDPRWRENRKLTTLIRTLRGDMSGCNPQLIAEEAADALEELQSENRTLAIQMNDMAELLEKYIDQDETIKWGPNE